jgi:hypothetical protein
LVGFGIKKSKLAWLVGSDTTTESGAFILNKGATESLLSFYNLSNSSSSQINLRRDLMILLPLPLRVSEG